MHFLSQKLIFSFFLSARWKPPSKKISRCIYFIFNSLPAHHIYKKERPGHIDRETWNKDTHFTSQIKKKSPTSVETKDTRDNSHCASWIMHFFFFKSSQLNTQITITWTMHSKNQVIQAALLGLPKADSSNFTDDLNGNGVYFCHSPNPLVFIFTK